MPLQISCLKCGTTEKYSPKHNLETAEFTTHSGSVHTAVIAVPTMIRVTTILGDSAMEEEEPEYLCLKCLTHLIKDASPE